MIKVITYGCLAPIEGAEDLEHVLGAAHQYANRLVEIERTQADRNAAADALLAGEKLPRLEGETLAEWRVRKSKAHGGPRTRQQQRKKKLAALLADDEVDAATKEYLAKQETAREVASVGNSGVPWGTANLVREAHTASVKKIKENAAVSLFRKHSKEGLAPPTAAETAAAVAKSLKHMPYREQDGGRVGRVGWQITNKATTVQQLPEFNVIIDEPVWQGERFRKHGTMKGTDPRCWTTVKIRVAGEARDPVYVTFPLTMYRPLPPNHGIKKVVVIKYRQGYRYKYELQVTLDVIEQERPKRPGAVAVQLCWDECGSYLTAALAQGSDGQEHSLMLDPVWISAMDHCDGLTRTANRQLRKALRVAEQLRRKGRLEGEDSSKPQTWVGPSRLACIVAPTAQALHPAWEAWFEAGRPAIAKWAREHGHDPVDFWLTCWLEQDMHLRQWAVDRRKRAMRQRLDQYRKWAVSLARQYGQLVLANERIDTWLQDKQTQRRRKLASPHDMRTCLLAAFDGQAFWVDPADPESMLDQWQQGQAKSGKRPTARKTKARKDA